MPKFELYDFVKYGKLFEIYGGLLSDDRQQIMNLYFNFNMTLSEISKEKEISRQAVLDSIKKSCQKLDEFEDKLKLNERKLVLRERLEALKNAKTLDSIKSKVDKMLEEL